MEDNPGKCGPRLRQKLFRFSWYKSAGCVVYIMAYCEIGGFLISNILAHKDLSRL
jgi:hypothetical protein